MFKKIVIPPSAEPRLILLDPPNTETEPRAALILPGRLPIVFQDIGRAVQALREVAP